jgi:uncharacterized protein with FMN-binding domain
MTRSSKIQAVITVALAAGAIAPATGAWAASKHALSTTRTTDYKGTIVTMLWGPVQAEIKVKNRKITSAVVWARPETFRSQFIDQQAAPLLQQETLHAQSAHIDLISGATLTSGAYIQSLQSAVKKARKDKLLR